jgi:hypothetical protein
MVSQKMETIWYAKKWKPYGMPKNGNHMVCQKNHIPGTSTEQKLTERKYGPYVAS